MRKVALDQKRHSEPAMEVAAIPQREPLCIDSWHSLKMSNSAHLKKSLLVGMAVVVNSRNTSTFPVPSHQFRVMLMLNVSVGTDL